MDGIISEYPVPPGTFSNRIVVEDDTSGYAYYQAADGKYYWEPNSLEPKAAMPSLKVLPQLPQLLPDLPKVPPAEPEMPWRLWVAMLIFVPAVIGLLGLTQQFRGAPAVPKTLERQENQAAFEKLKSLNTTKPKPTPTPDQSTWVESPGWPAGVPRAERVDAPWVAMPYGESLQINFRGELWGQNALPHAGNHVGDAFKIGKDIFVWVTPGGVGQWIDPVIP